MQICTRAAGSWHGVPHHRGAPEDAGRGLRGTAGRWHRQAMRPPVPAAGPRPARHPLPAPAVPLPPAAVRSPAQPVASPNPSPPHFSSVVSQCQSSPHRTAPALSPVVKPKSKSVRARVVLCSASVLPTVLNEYLL